MHVAQADDSFRNGTLSKGISMFLIIDGVFLLREAGIQGQNLKSHNVSHPSDILIQPISVYLGRIKSN